MAQEPTQFELILQSIQLIQKLRFGVGQVFKDLSEGLCEYDDEPQNKEDSTGDQGTASNSGSTTDKSDEQSQSAKQKASLKNLKASLQNIGHDIR